MKTAKTFTILNLSLSALFWLLGVLFFVLNVSRCWEIWQGVGFLSVYYLPVPAIASLLALFFAVKDKCKKLILTNAAVLVITAGVALFSYFVSANYG